MSQFLNNIWSAISTENETLIKILLIPASIIEAYLFMKIFLTIFDINSTLKKKFIYILSMTIIGILTTNFITSPLNILINYLCVFLLIKYTFNIDIRKSLIALVISSFVIALSNTLLQNPYLTLLNINLETFMSVPLYRSLYLAIFYFVLFSICIILKKFKNIKFNLTLIDGLDNKTLQLLSINLSIGFITLFIQLITTFYYIDIVPLVISILNFILLVAFLLLSIYSFTRVIKLANTTKNLQCAEEYNKSLEILYDKVKGFKHDFDNIISTLDGYIETNDMNGLKTYFDEVKKDCKITNNLSIINPRIINNPGIYSLLNNKYFKATNCGVSFEIEFFLILNNLNINIYHLSRILGILLDNAIEEAEKCEEKIVKVSFIYEPKNKRAVITIKNTYSNKNVDIEKIFEKGESGKKDHSGIGLWEVRNFVKKNKNLDLFTSKDPKYFKQELSIYD